MSLGKNGTNNDEDTSNNNDIIVYRQPAAPAIYDFSNVVYHSQPFVLVEVNSNREAVSIRSISTLSLSADFSETLDGRIFMAFSMITVSDIITYDGYSTGDISIVRNRLVTNSIEELIAFLEEHRSLEDILNRLIEAGRSVEGIQVNIDRPLITYNADNSFYDIEDDNIEDDTYISYIPAPPPPTPREEITEIGDDTSSEEEDENIILTNDLIPIDTITLAMLGTTAYYTASSTSDYFFR